jgi:hypothetical protein
MTTIAINEKYAEALSFFGNLDQAIDLALQRFAIEQITAKIAELRQRNAKYKAKYGLNYSDFARRVAQDETFVGQIETKTEKMWEADLADWEFCHKGIQDWTKKLENILLK